jgi:hypothetical protein
MTVRGALSELEFIALHLQEAPAQPLVCHADNDARMKGSWFVMFVSTPSRWQREQLSLEPA